MQEKFPVNIHPCHPLKPFTLSSPQIGSNTRRSKHWLWSTYLLWPSVRFSLGGFLRHINFPGVHLLLWPPWTIQVCTQGQGNRGPVQFGSQPKTSPYPFLWKQPQCMRHYHCYNPRRSGEVHFILKVWATLWQIVPPSLIEGWNTVIFFILYKESNTCLSRTEGI